VPVCLAGRRRLVSTAAVSAQCMLISISLSYRSPAPLSFPPHVIALASLYTASILLLESVHPGANTSRDPPTEAASDSEPRTERSTAELIELLRGSGDWESKYHTSWEQVDGEYRLLLIWSLYGQIRSSHADLLIRRLAFPPRPIHHHPLHRAF
jgi:CTD kinase subunit beta